MSGNSAEPSGRTNAPQVQWARLPQRRVYFGHQSVGRNILDGVADILRSEPGLQLHVIETAAPVPAPGPALVHSPVGRNGDPRSKLNAFAERLRSGTGRWADVAFFKFCYADIGSGSDVDALMLDYERTMDELNREFPSLTLLHVTVPLTSPPSLPRRLIKQLLGRRSNDHADNRQREVFNARLRARHAGDGSLFDLARIEATRPDGTLVDEGAALYRGYTSDRSHLNESGRVVVARAFLGFLAELV
jgi:hypothetical protein